MDDFGLYAILGQPRISHRRFAEICAEEEVRFLQIREKNLPDRALLTLIRDLVEVVRGSRTQIVVNDRPDLALLGGAHGLHLGQDDLACPDARRIIGPDRFIGLSTHSLEQARAAFRHHPDYIGFGPVFPTPTKEHPDPPTGCGDISGLLAIATCPIIFIGGLFPDNLGQVLDQGARNICLVRYLMETSDPRPRIRELRSLLSPSRPPGSTRQAVQDQAGTEDFRQDDRFASRTQ